MNRPPALQTRGFALGGERTAVVGILNVTPDSFSDGGLWMDPKRALEQSLKLLEEGALLVDIGGESTRPGARRITVEEEWDRVGALALELGRRELCFSIDTVNAETARRAVEAGAVLINDISGGVNDPKMAKVAAENQVGLVVQHFRGFPSDPTLDEDYGAVTSEVLAELKQQARKVAAEGVAKPSIVLDPGLGFAKTAEDSWKLVRDLDRFVSEGYPVLVGASRKRFVKSRYGNDVETGTEEVTRIAVAAGVWAVRVHEVARNVRCIEECVG